MDTQKMSPEKNLTQRSTIDELYEQSKYFLDQKSLNVFIDAVSEFVIVLNPNRQIVFANKRFAKFLGVANGKQAVGIRACEALQCRHASKTDGDYGAMDFCSKCGAYQALHESQEGKKSEKECQINRNNNLPPIEILIKATPYKLDNQCFTLFSAIDIGDEKRRKTLESIFFHDVLNTAGGLLGYSELLREAKNDEKEEMIMLVHELAEEIIDQIEAQRDLTKAENFDIHINTESLHSLNIIQSIIAQYKRHLTTRNKMVLIDSRSEDFIFLSDELLLKRVIGNLLKNAIEASGKEEPIILGCKRIDNTLQFWVKNKSVIPKEVQLQIFQRSFSTKGNGRGLGTYGIKLLTERYLSGRVSFNSNQDDGTTFTIMLPISIDSGTTNPIQGINMETEKVLVKTSTVQ